MALAFLTLVLILPNLPLASAGHAVAGAPMSANGPAYETALGKRIGADAPSATAQWPMFLHDLRRTGANLEERTVGVANASALGLLWSYNTTGGITGSIAVVNQTAYFGAWDGRLYAVSSTNGSFLWKTSLGGTKDWSNCGEPGIAATPIVWNNTVYIGGGNPWMYALNASTGSILWHVDLANVSGSTTPWTAHKIWSSGVIFNGSLYVGIASGCDNPLVRGALFQIALSDHTITHVFWTLPSGQVGPGIWSSPAVDPVTKTVWVTTGNEYLTDTKYARAVVGLNASNISQVVGYAQEAQPFQDLDFGDGATLFHSSTGTPMVVAVNKNGIAYAFNESGLHANGTSPTAWKVQVASPGSWSYAPPAFDGRTLYFGTVGVTLSNGTYVAGSIQAIDPDNGKLLWVTPTSSAVYAGVTYADGLVVAGLTGGLAGGDLLVLDASNGAILFDHTTLSINGEPIVVDGQVICASGSESATGGGNVESFGFTLSAGVNTSSVLGTVNDTFRFSARVQGGVTPYNLTWSLGDGTTAYGGTFSYSYPYAGLFNGTLTVTDARAVQVTVPFQLRAYLPLTAVPSLSSDPVNLGNTTTVAVNVGGGQAPYRYAWGPLPPGSPPVDSATSSFLLSPSTEGNYSIDVQVSSPSGQSINVSFPRLWVDGPIAYTILPSPSSGVLPLQVAFRALSGYSGVTGSYTWAFGDGATSTSVAPVHLFLTPGRFHVMLTITYPGGSRAIASTDIAAFDALALVGPGPVATDVGIPVDLVVAASGGAGAFAYSWSGLPTGCANHNASVLPCVPTESGAFPLTVSVRDPLGGSLQAYGVLVVGAPLSVRAAVNSLVNASCSETVPRAIADLGAIPSGGTAPVLVSWNGSEGTVSTLTDLRVDLAAPGSYEFTVTATDSVGGSANGTVSVSAGLETCPPPPESSSWSSPAALGAIGGAVALAVAAAAVVLLLRRRRRGTR